MKNRWKYIFAALATLALGLQAELITGVTIESVSSQIEGTYALQAVNIINGNGLTGGGGISSDIHGNIPTDNMWLTKGRPFSPQDLHPEITFNLGGLYDVNTLRIWNANATGYTYHGANQIKISAGATLESLTQTLTINVAQGGGTATEAAQDFASNFTNVQFVKFTIISNHDGDNFETQTFTGTSEEFAGLSEVRFETGKIADPAPMVDFSACPKPFQLYPRNPSNLADVAIAGWVTSSNCAEITVSVNRDGAAYTNLTQSLAYIAGQAAFAFTVPILSELAEYDFTVQVTSNSTPFTIVTADNVVAGDTLLVNGQSNAVAAKENGSANGNRSTWVRSFGYRSETAAVTENNLGWYMAEGDAGEGVGAIGQWALRMGRLMTESNGVPVAIINGARSGRPIGYYQRNDMDRTDLSTNYGRLLYRVQQAGLQNDVRAMLWYQGENDINNAASHENGWLQLYGNWRQDFPSIEKVYICQLHVGCGTTRELPDLRDRQRRLADHDQIIEVMSTTAVPSHTDTCHYAYENGYRVIGETLLRMVQRDLYGIAGSNINPPNPAYAYFGGANSSEIHVVMRDITDTLTWDAGAHGDFRLEGFAAAPTNGYATANTIVLQFDQNVSAATGLSYLSHIGSIGPYVKNATDVGLLAFYNISLLATDPGGAPGVPSQVQSIPINSNQVYLAWTPLDGTVAYLIKRDGILLGSTAVNHFIDYNVQSDQTYLYQVAAVGLESTSEWTTAIRVLPQNPPGLNGINLSFESNSSGVPANWTVTSLGSETLAPLAFRAWASGTTPEAFNDTSGGANILLMDMGPASTKVGRLSQALTGTAQAGRYTWDISDAGYTDFGDHGGGSVTFGFSLDGTHFIAGSSTTLLEGIDLFSPSTGSASSYQVTYDATGSEPALYIMFETGQNANPVRNVASVGHTELNFVPAIDPDPAFLSIVADSETVTISCTNLSASAGVINTLQTADNLIDGSWSDVSSVMGVTATNWIIIMATNQNFYRIKTAW